MNERPNTFNEYVAHKDAEEKNPSEVSFSYADSSYDLLLKKYKEAEVHAKQLVEEIYGNRWRNHSINNELNEQKRKLEQWREKLKIAHDIEAVNVEAGLPEDPELAVFIGDAIEHIKYLEMDIDTGEDAIVENDQNIESLHKNSVVMDQIHEDANKEHLDREQK